MLISIIIPTRERAEYLKAALATCVAIADPEIEIVVSDNASQDDTRTVVEGFHDPRIVYVNTGRRISMRQNFNHGIATSRGDYVIMIGDDDGMLPRQFPALRRIVEEFRPNVFSWRLVMYAWPGGGRHGHVRLKKEHTFGPPAVVGTEVLRRQFEAAEFAGPRIPRLYHGCVARGVLEGMRAKTGDYLSATLPDTYFEFYATFSQDSFLFAEHPFSIGGHGTKSNGGATRYSPTDVRAQPRLQFAAEAATDPLQESLPGPYPTMSAALLSALEMVKRYWSDTYRIVPDYQAWYRWILASDTHRPADYAAVKALLQGYAKSGGTFSALEAAARELGESPSRISHAMRRIGKNFRFDFRMTLSGRKDGANTVATAASVLDDILGEGYPEMGKSPRGRSLLWRSSRLRALGAMRLAAWVSALGPTRAALATRSANRLGRQGSDFP
ncbi:hypothetical protein BH10PSE9_BH10PSE9_06040 [soil metagenome]